MFLFKTLLLLSTGLVLCQSMVVPEETAVKMVRDPASLTRYYYMDFDNRNSPQLFDNTDITTLPFNLNNDIAILIHGHEGSAISFFGMYTAQALLNSNRSMSVILVDWSIIASYPHITARSYLSHLAIGIDKLIDDLEVVGKIQRKKLHLIGFDLGAHLAGMTGRIQSVEKITGLDPSRWDDDFYRGLNKNDAEMVEVIHTDGFGNRALGIGEQIGHVDIYPNGGTGQPGCSSNACSHERAWELFEATVEMGGHLYAFGCTDINQMSRNRCISRGIIVGTNSLFKLGYKDDKVEAYHHIKYDEILATLNSFRAGIYRVNTGRVYPYHST